MNKKLKIGIITLSASDNCGSCLQAYALKKILESYGEVDVINFSSSSSHMMYDLPQLNLMKRLTLHFSKDALNKRKRLTRCKKSYESFRINYLGIDVDNEVFADTLPLIADKYDIYVVGSDQVWNVQMADFDESFFLGWTKKKKVAYAPSLGGSDIRMANNASQYIKWINSFDYLSVREEVGLKCLKEIADKDVKKSLDPTLLLRKDDWEKLVGERIIDGEYIFYYSWAYCYEEELQIVKTESQRLGVPAVVIDSRKWKYKNATDYGFVLSKEEGPLAFLNLMYYAKYAYVESFHGLVFAYIFNKNFWLLDTHENLNELDSRLREFVNLLGAEERIITPYNYNNKNMGLEMEKRENDLLEDMRLISNTYLDEAMKI